MKRSCPNVEGIGDYIEGRVTDDDRLMIEEHLSECETCRQEFIVGKGIVRGSDDLELDHVPEEVTRSALSLVEKSAFISNETMSEKWALFFINLSSRLTDFFRSTIWGNWGLATIRGSKKVVSEDLVCISESFRDFKTDIEIERIGKSRKARIRIRIIGSNSNRTGIRVTLQRGERELSSYLSDKSGYILFEDIPFGHYNLVFKKDGITLGIYPFEIKEA